ncbi:MAG: response regulator [Candidatus Omnitrophica bacterium]|nr:response regulator [Candidatus Omnitrophota bacterium]
MSKKILIADDEPDIVRMLVSRLSAANYDVEVAYDGYSVIKKARETAPDLILMDYMMPAGNGVTTYDNLQKLGKLSLIPVIFITAAPTEELKQKVLSMGAVDLVPKPFDPVELMEKIKKVIGD